jgi:hypothetical protein
MDRMPEAANDHERTIAEAIESKLAANRPYESIVAEVAVSVPFDMSIADTQFLFNYAHWKLTQQMKKQPTRGVVPDDLKRSG